MEPRVKISYFTHKSNAFFYNFCRQSFASNIFGRESISNHDIALASFDDQIWFNQRQYVIQHWTSCLPVKNRSSELLFAGPSISRIFGSAKRIFKPYYEFFITTSYLKHAMPLKAIAIFALFNIANIQATFSIDKASQISYVPNLMICNEFYDFTHEFPFVNNISVVNEKVYAERLSEKTQKWGAIV